MTDLNEYECEMLDTLLAAFGVPDSLTRRQLLELFDGDEATAYTMVQVLVREGLVAEAGIPGQFELADKLILKPKGEKFLKAGGFTKHYQQEQKRPLEVGGTAHKLQQQNMRLQNQRLALESEIINLKRNLQRNQLLQYIAWVLVLAGLIIGYWLGSRHH